MEQLSKFYQQYSVKKYRRGEIILVQGEVPPCAYFIKSGIVKSYNLTVQGDEKPISFSVDGDYFPIAWTFGKVRYAQFYHEAFTDSELYAVPPQDFLEYLKKNPKDLFITLDSMANKLIGHQMRINALEQSKAAAKVINTIHYLCLRFGNKLGQNSVQIYLPLTQQDLANFMGLTRETTGIELKKLQKQGVLQYKRQKYVVNINKLDALLDEDYDQGIL